LTTQAALGFIAAVPKVIRDKFAKLKHLTRQQRYALRHKNRGLCALCPRRATIGTRCKRHANRIKVAQFGKLY